MAELETKPCAELIEKTEEFELELTKIGGFGSTGLLELELEIAELEIIFWLELDEEITEEFCEELAKLDELEETEELAKLELEGFELLKLWEIEEDCEEFEEEIRLELTLLELLEIKGKQLV